MSGRGGRGGGRGGPRVKGGRIGGSARWSRPKFTGACDALHGYIFDATEGRQAETYTKNMKALADYVGANTKYHGGDIRYVVEYLSDPTMIEPLDPVDGASLTRRRMWEKEVDSHFRRLESLEENKKVLFSLILGQCTLGMKSRLCGMATWETTKAGYDAMGLIKAIKSAMHNFGNKKDLVHAIHLAQRDFFLLHQAEGETNAAYFERFTAIVDLLEQHAGGFATHDEVINEELGGGATVAAPGSAQALENATKAAKDRYLACAFILQAKK